MYPNYRIIPNNLLVTKYRLVPAVASLWPMFAFTDPINRGSFLLEQIASATPLTSIGSPTFMNKSKRFKLSKSTIKKKLNQHGCKYLIVVIYYAKIIYVCQTFWTWPSLLKPSLFFSANLMNYLDGNLCCRSHEEWLVVFFFYYELMLIDMLNIKIYYTRQM